MLGFLTNEINTLNWRSFDCPVYREERRRFYVVMNEQQERQTFITRNVFAEEGLNELQMFTNNI